MTRFAQRPRRRPLKELLQTVLAPVTALPNVVKWGCAALVLLIVLAIVL